MIALHLTPNICEFCKQPVYGSVLLHILNGNCPYPKQVVDEKLELLAEESRLWEALTAMLPGEDDPCDEPIEDSSVIAERWAAALWDTPLPSFVAPGTFGEIADSL